MLPEVGGNMDAFFKIELDTTGPKIQVSTPKYTFLNIPLDISITSNEVLGEFQNISIIDRNNKVFNVILSKDASAMSMSGTATLSDLAEGICTLRVQVEDDVHNLSDRIETAFHLFDKVVLQITSSSTSRQTIISHFTRLITSRSFRRWRDGVSGGRRIVGKAFKRGVDSQCKPLLLVTHKS